MILGTAVGATLIYLDDIVFGMVCHCSSSAKPFLKWQKPSQNENTPPGDPRLVDHFGKRLLVEHT